MTRLGCNDTPGATRGGTFGLPGASNAPHESASERKTPVPRSECPDLISRNGEQRSASICGDPCASVFYFAYAEYPATWPSMTLPRPTKKELNTDTRGSAQINTDAPESLRAMVVVGWRTGNSFLAADRNCGQAVGGERVLPHSDVQRSTDQMTRPACNPWRDIRFAWRVKYAARIGSRTKNAGPAVRMSRHVADWRSPSSLSDQAPAGSSQREGRRLWYGFRESHRMLHGGAKADAIVARAYVVPPA
jgi:hypothetical protein